MITGGLMNRLLIPLALVVLVAGCAMPNLFGQQASQPVPADTAQTVVVREIYHETPVVYVDTVYMAADPEPVQPVYVNEEYNEYNEYNHTDVYMHEHVIVPPPRGHRERGWSPPDRGQQPRDWRRDDGSQRDRNQPRDEKPKVVNPQHPVKKMNAPVTSDRQKSPVPPTQPVPPKRRSPAQGGVPVAPMPHENPRQIPTPPADKSPSHGSDAVQGQAGTDHAGTVLLAAQGK
jgi:hypothetical protein